jgi:hypothetical protein
MENKKDLGPPMITAAGIKERGWTDAMIRNILGTADLLKPNPIYKCASPMRLYDLARVENAEKTETWNKLKSKALLRGDKTRKVAAKRAGQLIEEAETINVEVQKISLGKLEKRAIESWKDHKYYLGKTFDEVPKDVERLMVNYLRHECTYYEAWLDEYSSKPGAHEARWIIRKKVYDVIAKNYPSLAKECTRQIAYRLGFLIMDENGDSNKT